MPRTVTQHGTCFIGFTSLPHLISRFTLFSFCSFIHNLSPTTPPPINQAAALFSTLGHSPSKTPLCPQPRRTPKLMCFVSLDTLAQRAGTSIMSSVSQPPPVLQMPPPTSSISPNKGPTISEPKIETTQAVCSVTFPLYVIRGIPSFLFPPSASIDMEILMAPSCR